MKKHEYVSPEVEIADVEIQCYLFETSGDILPPDLTDPGDKPANPFG